MVNEFTLCESLLIRRIKQGKGEIAMEFLTTKDVLERFQIPYHRLAYLFSSRRVPEVRKTSSGSRLYGEGDVERIRAALDDIGEATRRRCTQDHPGGQLG